MRWLTAALLFVTAFLAGAGLFLITRPAPVLRAIVMELEGPGLFERCRRGTDTVRTDRLRGTFELVRGGCERRQIAGARCGRNLPFGRNRGVAEFRQQ